MAASAGFMKLAQAAADGDPAAIALAANRDSSPFDGPGTTENVAKHFPFEIHEVSKDDTERDERTTDEIARLLAVADTVLGRESPHGSVTTHRAKTVGQRRLEEARALAGGRPQNPIER